jgi:hypothetical protein
MRFAWSSEIEQSCLLRREKAKSRKLFFCLSPIDSSIFGGRNDRRQFIVIGGMQIPRLPRSAEDDVLSTTTGAIQKDESDATLKQPDPTE